MNNKNKDYIDGWEKFEVETFKKDKELASICLDDEIKEYNNTGDISYLKQQLKSMAKAYGWSNLERDTRLTRATLYSTLNNKTEPKLKNFLNIINVLGFKLSIEPINAINA
jgi:probable addiction module antidote protein